MKNLLKELEKRILVIDGAMGTMLQKHDLSDKDFGGKKGCNEYLNLIRPEIIQEIHEQYIEAGADCIETNTFGGNLAKLKEFGLEKMHDEINSKAVELAQRAIKAQKKAGKVYILAALGPSGFLPSSNNPDLSKVNFDEQEEMYFKQAKIVGQAGADAFLIETGQDILEIKAAVCGCQKARTELKKDILIMAQATLDINQRMLLGTDISAVLTALEAVGADVLGLNCSTGPDEMRQSIKYLSNNSRLFVSVVPNAGLPHNTEQGAVYPLDPKSFAKKLCDLAWLGVNFVGGCCGTSPEHIKELASQIKNINPRKRKKDTPIHISSGIASFEIKQENPPLIVGERINTQGSRKMKELLLKKDYEGIRQLAVEQEKFGAQVLDVCTAVTENNLEKEEMVKLCKLLSNNTACALMIDSTEPEVIAAALKTAPGKCIINSINLEDGGKKIEKIAPLMKKFGSPTIALTIDKAGMAATAEKKLKIAKRIVKEIKKYGLAESHLIFDPLTFTLGTGEEQYKNSAQETLAAVKLIKKQFPKSFTNLGISNISFGLPPAARKVINAVFLYQAVKVGMDTAIINPAQLVDYNSLKKEEIKLAENLIFNKTKDALPKCIAYFSKVKLEEKVKPKQKPTLEDALKFSIIHRDTANLEDLLEQALQQYPAVDIINHILLPAMEAVGEKFGKGETILPFVLQSAEVMKKAINYVEPHLEKNESINKGTVVLATVYGDVHDIGKNLVKTILVNNGFKVVDLGKQAPIQTIIEEAVKHKALAIGLSALLISTSKQMEECVKELYRQKIFVPVLIGGAATNRAFGRKINFVDGDMFDPHGAVAYPGGVFYAKDAFASLDILTKLAKSEKSRKEIIEKAILDARNTIYKEKTASAVDIKRKDKKTKSKISFSKKAVVPPAWGNKLVKDIPLQKIFSLINTNSLFRLSWGIKGKQGKSYESIVKNEFLPLKAKLEKEILEQKLISPSIIYGYYACQSKKEMLTIFNEKNKNIAEIYLPRHVRHGNISLADYFRSSKTKEKDLIAFHIATVGKEATQLCSQLQEKGEYTKSYYFHGLFVAIAEALAEYIDRKIHQELKIPHKQGKRYSPGYPACPDIKLQRTFFDILDAEKQIGVSLTSAYQIVPEQSTSAFYCFHPEARYFV